MNLMLNYQKNVIFPLLKSLMKSPGSRRILNKFMFYFITYDDLFLYYYHERTYGPSMENLFEVIIVCIKLAVAVSGLQNDLPLSKHQLYGHRERVGLPLRLLYQYSVHDETNEQSNPLPQLYKLLYRLLHLSDCRLPSFQNPFPPPLQVQGVSFIQNIFHRSLLSCDDGGRDHPNFKLLLFSEMQWLVSFQIYHKMYYLALLALNFILVIFLSGIVYIFHWWYGSLGKYLMEYVSKSMKAYFYFLYQNYLRCFVMAGVHAAPINYFLKL